MKKLKKTINFDGSCHDYLMRVNGLSCGFNMPDSLEGEEDFSLPPYAKRMPFLVDEYPACPENWMRSEGKTKSYFVPVEENKGMWLDFNLNENNSHHVAIVVSIQGINPITGLPCKDAQLEQYIEECPKHKIKFGPDRYCKKCDYKWPKQNYISTTGTPNGYLWLDGFRSVEGMVRQYILTAEKMRGVASNIIGKDRVYAVGISFFLSKEKRPPKPNSILRNNFTTTWTNINPTTGTYINYPTYSPTNAPDYYTNINWTADDDFTKGLTSGIISANSISTPDSLSESSEIYKRNKSSKNMFRDCMVNVSLNVRSIKTKKLEVGAGANIVQSVYDDPEKLDYWHEDSEGIICINYCLEKEAKEIIEAGKINIEGHKEGFLKDVPVGN